MIKSGSWALQAVNRPNMLRGKVIRSKKKLRDTTAAQLLVPGSTHAHMYVLISCMANPLDKAAPFCHMRTQRPGGVRSAMGS